MLPQQSERRQMQLATFEHRQDHRKHLRKPHRIDVPIGLILTHSQCRQIKIVEDRKSTRLNSSHSQISYAVFCLKKKNRYKPQTPQRTKPAPTPPKTSTPPLPP